MKIREFMKKRKIVVTVCCIAALIGGVFIYGAVQPEAVQAKAADRAERIESDAGNKTPAKDEKKQETQEKAEKVQNVVDKENLAADEEKSAVEPSTFKSNPSGGSSDSGQKKQERSAESSQAAPFYSCGVKSACQGVP